MGVMAWRWWLGAGGGQERGRVVRKWRMPLGLVVLRVVSREAVERAAIRWQDIGFPVRQTGLHRALSQA